MKQYLVQNLGYPRVSADFFPTLVGIRFRAIAAWRRNDDLAPTVFSTLLAVVMQSIRGSTFTYVRWLLYTCDPNITAGQ